MESAERKRSGRQSPDPVYTPIDKTSLLRPSRQLMPGRLLFVAAIMAFAGCDRSPTDPDEEDQTPDAPYSVAVRMRDDPGITILRSNGTVEGRISCTTQCSILADPRWSRDGRMLSVTSRRDTLSILLVVNRDGTGMREVASVPRILPVPGKITTSTYPDFHADWSADGELVYTRSTSTETSLETVNTDGTSRNVIYKDAVGLESASYRVIVARWGSTDGTISAGIDGAIYAMNSDGSNRRLLTPGISGAGVHNWSPDGRSIAFSADVGGRSALMSVDVASGAIRTIFTSNDARHMRSYCWSPNSARFSLVVNEFPTALLTTNADGTGLREEVTGIHNLSLPKAPWSPDGRYLFFLEDKGIPAGSRGMQLYAVRLRDRTVAPVTDIENLQNYSLAVAEGDRCSI